MQKTRPYQDDEDMKHVTSENTYYLTLRKYLIPNTCGWMQKTRLYQEDDDMKQVTSENT